MARLSHAVKGAVDLGSSVGGLKREPVVIERGRGDGREGYRILSFENDKDLERRRKSEQASDPRNGKSKNSRKKSAGSAEVGGALRSIYQRTVNEDIPPDLLDLLGKLG
jgi:hypothetical protein